MQCDPVLIRCRGLQNLGLGVLEEKRDEDSASGASASTSGDDDEKEEDDDDESETGSEITAGLDGDWLKSATVAERDVLSRLMGRRGSVTARSRARPRIEEVEGGGLNSIGHT